MRLLLFFRFLRFGISKAMAMTTKSAMRPAIPPTAMRATTMVEMPPMEPDMMTDGWAEGCLLDGRAETIRGCLRNLSDDLCMGWM